MQIALIPSSLIVGSPITIVTLLGDGAAISRVIASIVATRLNSVALLFVISRTSLIGKEKRPF